MNYYNLYNCYTAIYKKYTNIDLFKSNESKNSDNKLNSLLPYTFVKLNLSK